MKKLISKFNKSYLKLVIYCFFAIAAGIHLVVSPETVKPIIIRVIGSVWILEGGNYFLKIILKYQRQRNEQYLHNRRNGEYMLINEMTNGHLVNTIKLYRRKGLDASKYLRVSDSRGLIIKREGL